MQCQTGNYPGTHAREIIFQFDLFHSFHAPSNHFCLAYNLLHTLITATSVNCKDTLRGRSLLRNLIRAPFKPHRVYLPNDRQFVVVVSHSIPQTFTWLAVQLKLDNMKLVDKIANRQDSSPFFTFEFFPPKTEQVRITR